jgi:urease accessory protein
MTRLAFTLIVLFASTVPAAAHPGPALSGSLVEGFFHPLNGPDHLLAMLGLGIWASVMGGRLLWALPSRVSFFHGFGALAFQLLPLSYAGEWLILASAIFFLAAARLRLAALALPLTAFFALAHGHAHGSELSLRLSDPGPVLGFLASTAMLHLIGVLAYLTSSTEVRARRATSYAIEPRHIRCHQDRPSSIRSAGSPTATRDSAIVMPSAFNSAFAFSTFSSAAGRAAAVGAAENNVMGSPTV